MHPSIRAVLIAVVVTHPLTAQSGPDVVRGRVTDDSSRVVAGASVSITRGPDRLLQTAKTDSTGCFSSRFDIGTGDYLVHVDALGFRPARRRIQRAGGERELVADFTLGRDMTLLATVKVKADKPVRASNAVSPYTPEVGSSQSWSDGVNGRVTPSAAGDLAALAGTLPGVTMTGSGPSMLGAPSSSNLTTLNGMALAGGALPRAARTDLRVTGATFDPTRGGFAGANIDVRLAAGDRSYQQRNVFFTLDAPQLQSTDAVGRSLGLQNSGFRGSLGADGELIRRVLLYNVAIDVSRDASDPASLLGTDSQAWRRAGVAPDSVARLLSLASIAGIPLGGGGVPTTRVRNGYTYLGRFDVVSDSLRTLTLTTYASRNREGSLGAGPLVAPAAGGQNLEQTVGSQFVHSAFVGADNNVLTQNRLAASRVHQQSTPYQALPGVSVLVRSASDAATSDVAALTVGGNPWLAIDDTRWVVEGSNETMLNRRGSKHRIKSQLWGRADGLRQEGLPNSLGQYAYNSLADFQANRPSSYSRTLTQPVRTATTYNGALAVAHQWNKSKFFSLLYGARAEANAFGDAPPVNAALNAALGVQSGIAPSRLHVSPRLGFSYTYSRAKDNGSGMSSNQLGTFYRPTLGFIRGGIGEFRDLYNTATLADASVGAGLVGSTLSLSCVGAAVPIPNWDELAANPSALPTACADGSGALSERAPSVTLIDPSFDVPRSWRASLGWASTLGRWMVKVDGLGSYDLSQPSTLDANFSGVTRFALAGEGNRPVFVSPNAIDANTGAVSAREARRSNDFGRVALRTSDLRGYGGQLTTTIQPDVFRRRRGLTFFTSASYTVQRLQRQYRGGDGATFGDPRTKEWATGTNEARHAVVLQGGISVPKVGQFTLFSRVQSGLPFTPLVQGDINGDGRANDRAFVPAQVGTTDAALAAQMRALLTSAPGNVRECLERQLGAVAGRNSCRGAWTQALNLQWQPRIPLTVQGRNLQATVAFQNPLGGIDQLLHGEANLRGWGTRALPDPVLLVPRGFEPAAQRFRYDVNPRFGDTRAFRTLSREPFRVTLDFSLNFSTPYDVQQLRRALEPVRSKQGWERRSVDSLAGFYMRGTSSVMRAILSESDSLFLTNQQIAQLVAADSVFHTKSVAIYRPLAEYLATLPTGVAGKAALDSAHAAEKAYWLVFWDQVDVMELIMTPQQRELMPMLKNIISVTKEARKNSRWFIGFQLPVTYTRPRIGGS